MSLWPFLWFSLGVLRFLSRSFLRASQKRPTPWDAARCSLACAWLESKCRWRYTLPHALHASPILKDTETCPAHTAFVWKISPAPETPLVYSTPSATFSLFFGGHT